MALPKRAHVLCPTVVAAGNSNSLAVTTTQAVAAIVVRIAGSKRMRWVNFIQGWILINSAISALPSRELLLSELFLRIK